MKLSVSLPGDDVQFLDEYAKVRRLGSRSAVVHRAVELLRAAELAADYEAAWEEWSEAGEAELWEPVVDDGIDS